MTTHDKDKIIALRNEADKFATNELSCEGEYHPDFHTVSDERFYAIAFEDGRQSVDTPVALAEAYRCGEEAGRKAEREECAKEADYYRNHSALATIIAKDIRARSTK